MQGVTSSAAYLQKLLSTLAVLLSVLCIGSRDESAADSSNEMLNNKTPGSRRLPRTTGKEEELLGNIQGQVRRQDFHI